MTQPKSKPWWLDPRGVDPASEQALQEGRTMGRYAPLIGGLTVFFAIILVALGLVLLSYEEVGSAILLFAMGFGGLLLVPIGLWMVRRK
jgi:hypothetical protein